MFDPLWKLALGLLTGIIFGVLLQKGCAAKFHVIVGQFLLRDWTVVKIMLTAIAVGAVGVYALLPLSNFTLHLKPLAWGGLVCGGILFGAGVVILGYCPGTSVAACGEGRRDAIAGVLGMLSGAALYVAAYPFARNLMDGLGEHSKQTLAELTHTSPWLWIAGLVSVVGLVFLLQYYPLLLRNVKVHRRSVAMRNRHV